MKQTFDIMATIYEQAKLFEACVGEPALTITVSPRSYRRLLDFMISDEEDTSRKLHFPGRPVLSTKCGQFVIFIDEMQADDEVILY